MPFLIYTDARGAGLVAATVFYDGTALVARKHWPERFLQGRRIYEYGLTGEIVGVTIAALLMQGMPVISRRDKSAAAIALIRGN